LTYSVEPLCDGHDLTSFHCGHAALDDWLMFHARNAAGQGTRTYVLLDEARTLAGYFAIAPHLVEREELPRRIGRGAPNKIPAVLLAKLALHERFHGQGLGAELLVWALTTIVGAARAAGGKLIVVDAIDDTAAGFYRHHDLRAASDDDPHRLVMKISTAARALGLPWP
jgi:GNAT superfamily N-acetyltransferase